MIPLLPHEQEMPKYQVGPRVGILYCLLGWAVLFHDFIPLAVLGSGRLSADKLLAMRIAVGMLVLLVAAATARCYTIFLIYPDRLIRRSIYGHRTTVRFDDISGLVVIPTFFSKWVPHGNPSLRLILKSGGAFLLAGSMPGARRLLKELAGMGIVGSGDVVTQVTQRSR